MIYRSYSSAETKKIAAAFAKGILKRRPGSHALVIGLSGDLGAGKTTFIQGFLRVLGIRGRITSPTFVLVKRYTLRPPRRHVHHMDSYRLNDHRHLKTLDFKKIISDPKNIVLIEWAEKIKKALPKDTLWIRFGHEKKESERKIIIMKKR